MRKKEAKNLAALYVDHRGMISLPVPNVMHLASTAVQYSFDMEGPTDERIGHVVLVRGVDVAVTKCRIPSLTTGDHLQMHVNVSWPHD